MQETIRELQLLYPDILWYMIEPSDEILRDYGNGTILAGSRGNEMKDFLILEKDENKLQWGHVIANYLNKTVEEIEE
jgi:hypothetical protein